MTVTVSSGILINSVCLFVCVVGEQDGGNFLLLKNMIIEVKRLSESNTFTPTTVRANLGGVAHAQHLIVMDHGPEKLNSVPTTCR